jgi:CRP/FNR family cyclic AMP-dependent transcriptional regulator
MKQLSRLLEQNPVFASLKPNETAELVRMAVKRGYQKDEKIILYGEVWSYLFLVGEGSVEAVKESSEGRNLHVATFDPGELFWGLSFFIDDAPMPVTLETHTGCVLYVWSRENLQPFFLAHGKISWELSRLMADRMLRASEIVQGLAFQPVAGRLAGFLLEHFQGVESEPVARSLTLDEMAAHIGSTREVVCRFLRRFADAGLIDISRTEFTLANRAGLSDLAQRKG